MVVLVTRHHSKSCRRYKRKIYVFITINYYVYELYMSVEIVTYANKSQGMYEELINNEFGIPIKVLGWGLHFYIDIQKNNLSQSSF
jgi:hypothetical protein